MTKIAPLSLLALMPVHAQQPKFEIARRSHDRA
jgi:hypothetical protein